jgi:hypothetical protein
MTIRNDSDLGDWRQRMPRGSRDIAIAVLLTMLALGMVGGAWLRGSASHSRDPIASNRTAPEL